MDWQCDITKTWPLTLLDTLRKMVMKVITNHLAALMVKYNILKENNFTDLLRGSMKTLIKLMNMIIEDAKVNRKLIWILL